MHQKVEVGQNHEEERRSIKLCLNSISWAREIAQSMKGLLCDHENQGSTSRTYIKRNWVGCEAHL